MTNLVNRVATAAAAILMAFTAVEAEAAGARKVISVVNSPNSSISKLATDTGAASLGAGVQHGTTNSGGAALAGKNIFVDGNVTVASGLIPAGSAAPTAAKSTVPSLITVRNSTGSQIAVEKDTTNAGTTGGFVQDGAVASYASTAYLPKAVIKGNLAVVGTYNFGG